MGVQGMQVRAGVTRTHRGGGALRAGLGGLVAGLTSPPASITAPTPRSM
jgi:hypothetical protein